MKKTEIIMNKRSHNMYTDTFVNKYYKKEWEEFVPGWEDRDGNPVPYAVGTYITEDLVNYAIYDGGQNYMGSVNKATGEIKYNTSKDEYKDSFLLSAKEVICK